MTVEEFQAIYTKITASPVTIQTYLDMFICQYGEDYDCMQDHLQGLFAAHRLTVFNNAQNSNGAPNMIKTSKRVGDVSVGGFVAGSNDSTFSDFGTTAYGIEFTNTMRIYGGGPMMAGNANG